MVRVMQTKAKRFSMLLIYHYILFVKCIVPWEEKLKKFTNYIILET